MRLPVEVAAIVLTIAGRKIVAVTIAVVEPVVVEVADRDIARDHARDRGVPVSIGPCISGAGAGRTERLGKHRASRDQRYCKEFGFVSHFSFLLAL